MNDSYVYDEEMKELEILIDDVHYRYLFDVELVEEYEKGYYQVMVRDIMIMCHIDKDRVKMKER